MGLGDASAGLGLHHQDFLPKSLSTHEALFLAGIGGIYARLIFAHFGAKRCRACRRCWALALQNAVNTVKKLLSERWAVVLSVLFLLWLARVLRGPCFFPVGFRAFWRARARAQPEKLLFTVFCCVCVSGLACGLLFLRPLTRARPHVSLLGWGPAAAQKAGIPGINLGLGWATRIP